MIPSQAGGGFLALRSSWQTMQRWLYGRNVSWRSVIFIQFFVTKHRASPGWSGCQAGGRRLHPSFTGPHSRHENYLKICQWAWLLNFSYAFNPNILSISCPVGLTNTVIYWWHFVFSLRTSRIYSYPLHPENNLKQPKINCSSFVNVCFINLKIIQINIIFNNYMKGSITAEICDFVFTKIIIKQNSSVWGRHDVLLNIFYQLISSLTN